MSHTEMMFGQMFEPQIVEENLGQVLDKFNAAYAQRQNFVPLTDYPSGAPVVISITDVIKMREVDPDV